MANKCYICGHYIPSGKTAKEGVTPWFCRAYAMVEGDKLICGCCVEMVRKQLKQVTSPRTKEVLGFSAYCEYQQFIQGLKNPWLSC